MKCFIEFIKQDEEKSSNVLVWFFTSQSTAMVMSGWSVHLATLFFPGQA